MKNVEAILGLRSKFKLTASEFLFLMYIAHVGNDKDRDFAERGEAWPSYRTIQADIGIDKKNVWRILKRLSKHCDWFGCMVDYKNRPSYTYFIDYDKIAKLLAVGATPTASRSDTYSEVGEVPTAK